MLAIFRTRARSKGHATVSCSGDRPRRPGFDWGSHYPVSRSPVSYDFTGQRRIRVIISGAIGDHVIKSSAATRQIPVSKFVEFVSAQYDGGADHGKCDPL